MNQKKFYPRKVKIITFVYLPCFSKITIFYQRAHLTNSETKNWIPLAPLFFLVKSARRDDFTPFLSKICSTTLTEVRPFWRTSIVESRFWSNVSLGLTSFSSNFEISGLVDRTSGSNVKCGTSVVTMAFSGKK